MSDFYSNGTRWGRIDNDGRIYSSDSTYLGRIYNDGRFYDSSYTYMGSIDENGEIWNYKGDYLGSIQSNGELLNDLGEYIGMFPYYNGRIGKFSTNHTSSTNNDTSTKKNETSSTTSKNETSSTTPQTTSNSGGSSVPTPVLLPEDDLGFYIVLILGIILVFGGYLKIKEVIHTPYIIILIPLSIISTVLFLLAEEEESSTWDKIKPLFIINFTLCVLWTVILNYIIFERDIFLTIGEVLINYLVANLVFASVMTIISLIINSIFEYLIDYSEGFLKFLLLFFCVFTCILIAVHANKLKDTLGPNDDPPPTTATSTEKTTETTNDSKSMSIENKIDNIASNYNNIQDNLDSMDVDRYEEGKVYYSEGSIKKMLLYTYQDCYTMEAFYEDLMPNFIYLKDNDTDEEYRYYYDNEQLIRYIDSDGQATNYEDGLDVSTDDVDDSEESEMYFDAYQAADSVSAANSPLE